jgi:hypothetical protein
MVTKFQINKTINIDSEMMAYVMAEKTPAARNAMNLLKGYLTGRSEDDLALLQCAVEECSHERRSPVHLQ